MSKDDKTLNEQSRQDAAARARRDWDAKAGYLKAEDHRVLESIENLRNMSAIVKGIQGAQALCHQASRDGGWYTNIETGEPLDRNVSEMMMLIVSEISEAQSGMRKDEMDHHLPHRKAVEVELADAMIRTLDLAGFLELDLAVTIMEKLEYNRNRADHKIENRKKKGGKKL